MINCREADNSDIDLIIPLIKEYFEEYNRCSIKKRLWVDIDAITTINNAINNDEALLCVAEEDGNILGVGMVYIVPDIMNFSARNPIESIWHSSPKIEEIKRYKVQIKLLEYMESWSKMKTVEPLMVSVTNKNTLKKYLEQVGYKESEITMYKEVL